MAPLSLDERISSLVCGYVRRIAKGDSVPLRISSLCCRYVGDSEYFSPRNLMTLKESGHDCCGRNTCCGAFAKQLHIFKSDACIFSLVAIVILLKFAVDVAALVIASIFHEENAHDPISAVHFVDITSWLYIGGITDIMICAILLFGSDLERKYIDTEPFHKESGLSGCCLFLFIVTFYSLWAAFGFLLWSEMSPNRITSIIVLCWSSLSSVFGVIGCGTMFIIHCKSCLQSPIRLSCNLSHLSVVDVSVLLTFGCLMVMAISKDSAALIVGLTMDCGEGTNQQRLFHFLDVNDWLIIGAFIDMILCFLLLFKKRAALWPSLFFDCGIEMWCLRTLIGSFYASWTVFGFMLWIQADSDSICSKMTLSWCILSGGSILLPLCCLCCLCMYYRVCTPNGSE